jgi:Fe-S-cluster containining protein
MDCINCEHDRICCSKYGVTLTKEELQSRFFRHKKITTLFENGKLLGYVFILKKKKSNNSCYYQNDKTGLCNIYEDRPQACRNYDCIGKF